MIVSTSNILHRFGCDNMASPLKIMIATSNGASDYGNKFGEPMIRVAFRVILFCERAWVNKACICTVSVVFSVKR